MSLFSVHPKIVEIPPRYLDGLYICKGDTIQVRNQYRGKPEPNVTWSVEGEVIERKRRVDIKVTPKHSTLTINDSERPDSGTYKIQVENKLGSDSLSIPIKVIGKFLKTNKIYISYFI